MHNKDKLKSCELLRKVPTKTN